MIPSPDPRLLGVAQQLADQRADAAPETGSQDELAIERRGAHPVARRSRLASARATITRGLARILALRGE